MKNEKMKKTKHTPLEVVRNERIEHISGYSKWNTNIPNVFVYDVQLGWGFSNQIRRGWETCNYSFEDIYKENAIIIEWRDYINGIFCGGCRLFKSKSFTKEKYSIKDEKYECDFTIRHHFN